MALTQGDKKEVESIVRKEIKDFFGSNTYKQFEDKMIDRISKDVKRGKIEGNIKELILKSFREFYTIMYQQRHVWEGKFRNM